MMFAPFCFLKLKRIGQLPTTSEMTSVLAVHLASVEDIVRSPSFGISNQNSRFYQDMGTPHNSSNLETFGTLPRAARVGAGSRYQDTGARPKCLSHISKTPSRISERATLENIELADRNLEGLSLANFPSLTSPPPKPFFSILKEKSSLTMPKMRIQRFVNRS